MTGTRSARVAKWRNGAGGFFQWLTDVQPRVPSSKGGYEVFQPGPREAAEIRAALDGEFRTICFCWPRRHGKTLVSALIICWRFLTRKTQSIAIVANSEKQTVDTAFKTIAVILKETPYTAGMIKSGAIKVMGDRIEYASLGNVIQGFSSSPAALYGKKLSIAQISELHAASSDAAYQVLASSTIDSDDALVLVDSTVGPRSSPLYSLYSVAQQGTDPTLFFSHIEYRDLADACANCPPWISPAALRSRAAQMLPGEFSQQHLNRWGDSQSALFPPDILNKCRDTYRLDVQSIVGEAAHIVGAGLDRAFGFSVHGDATVTTCVVKVLLGEDEHYFVLASDQIRFSSAGGIKRALSRYASDYGMTRAVIESYNSQDIAAWCADQAFDHEVVHPTAERQANAFTALYLAAAEGRLHISPAFEKLFAEMAAFEYRQVSTGTSQGAIPRFEAAKGSHDDHVYSLAWSVYALRDVELNPYEINGIHCAGPGPAVALCVLNGGDGVPPCADTCRSMRAARGLYDSYRSRGHLTPLPFPMFALTKVKNIGAHTLPR